MAKTIPLYTLDELREQYPDGYQRAIEDFQQSVLTSSEPVPWAEEVMDSLRGAIEACYGKMVNWNIGPGDPRLLRVDVENESPHCDADTGEQWGEPRDAEWLWEEVLQPMGYEKNDGGVVQFPGLCKLTGYCADEDFLEAAYQDLVAGRTLKEALEGLVYVAARLMEQDLEQACSEEEAQERLADDWFTEDGRKF